MSLAGKLIGSYRIEDEIGRGGMATIYRAVDIRTNQSVALKILLPQYVNDPITLRRFRQEGENSKKLRHPNIIKVFEAGIADGLHYIAMEYASRGTLAQMLKQKGQPLSTEEAVPILRRVAAALDYAHSRNILHRDVKPSNILIGDNGQILLSDFGVARQIASDATVVTTVGFSVGTPSYMSPEQAQGDYDLTPRSDIYSLGVVAYAMLTAALPFDAESQLALLRKIIDDGPKSPDLHNPKLPTGVSYALQRVLAKEPESRYATASEFVDALEKGISWQPSAHDWSTLARVAARAPLQPGPTYRESPQQHNVAGSLALLLGLLAVLLAAFALFRPNVSRLLTSFGVPSSITSAVFGNNTPITESLPTPATIQPNAASETITLTPSETPTPVPATGTFTPLPSETATLELSTLTPTLLIAPLVLKPFEDQTLHVQINAPQNWRQSHLGSALYFESPDHSSLFFVDRLTSTPPLVGAEEAIAAYLANVNTPFSMMELISKEQIAKDGLTIWQQTYNAILIGGAQSTVRLSLLELQERYYLLGYSVAPSNLDSFESIFNIILNDLIFLVEPTAISTASATTTPTPTATKTNIPTPSATNTATTQLLTINTSEPVSQAVALAPTLIPLPMMDASATPHPTETATQHLPATFTPNPTEIATLTPTSAPIPTATNSRTPTIEETPTSTFTLLPTSTPLPTNTETSTSTITNTPKPTSTPVPANTETNTPTATYTPKPTSTPVPTATPSDTPDSSATEQAQLDRIATMVAQTLTAIPTNTSLQPTATNTATATFTSTQASTSVPTKTNTLTPQATATVPPSPTATSQRNSLPELYATLESIDAALTALAPLLTPTIAPATATPVPTYTALPTSTNSVASTPTIVATATPNVKVAPPPPDLITGFESFGSWQRGNEPYGSFTQSNAQVYEGAFSGKLAYEIAPNAGDHDYVVFLAQSPLPIPTPATGLEMQVYGDSSGDFLNVWVEDTKGQRYQFSFGRIQHSDWQPLSLSFDLNQKWPNGPIAPANITQLYPPLRVKAFVFDHHPDSSLFQGEIYLDALRATNSPSQAIQVSPPTATAQSPAAQPTSKPVAAESTPVAGAAPAGEAPVPIGGLQGKLAVPIFNGATMDILVYNIADGALLARYANRRQPDYGKCGVLLANGDGGGTNDIVRIFADGSIREVTSNTEDSWPQWSPSCESVAYASFKLGGSSLVYWQVDASDRFDAPPLKYNKGDWRGRYTVYLDNWRIAYNGCNYWASGSNCGIYTTDTKGGEPNRASDQSDDIPSDSMGSRILFHARRSGNWDVWAVNFDGSGLQQLTNSPANDGLATASPDFQHIVFLSNRDGNWAIYVMNVDGSNQQKLFNIEGGYGGGEYDWSQERLSWGN